MSNPNNLVRPSVLSPQPPTPPTQQTNMTMEQMTATITDIVNRVFQAQGRQLVQSTLNPNANFSNFTDQTIDPSFINNLPDLDKIPDVVRCLREFSGNPGEFNSWKKGVDRIIQIYEPIRGTPKYYGILSVIRNKIVGNADMALESYNTPLNWKAISKCLTLHYADKRDVGTLEYQMMALIQGNDTIQDFYQRVYSHLSLITNKIGCMEMSEESLHLLTQTYRDKALDTFVRGLNGDLPRLLGIREPADLPQALHLCLKLENQNFRTNYAFKTQKRNFYNNAPQLPPKKSNPNFVQQLQTFQPQLAYMPQPYINSSPWKQNPKPFNHPFQAVNQPQVAPPRPFGAKPLPKPEPMDIDASMRTRGVNYMNRPRQNVMTCKRPHLFQNQEPRKVQRNFHIDQDNNQLQEHFFYQQALVESENQYETQEGCTEEHNDTTDIEALDASDIHFLD